jgi:hypothetical protein
LYVALSFRSFHRARPKKSSLPWIRQALQAPEHHNVLATPLFFFNRHAVIGRAAALHLPAMYQWPEMAEEGGFIGYGPRITEWYRQLARLVAKVLSGVSVSDLPVEQPTRFELVIVSANPSLRFRETGFCRQRQRRRKGG